MGAALWWTGSSRSGGPLALSNLTGCVSGWVSRRGWDGWGGGGVFNQDCFNTAVNR